MTRYFLAIFASVVLTSCGKPSAPGKITVSAQGVRLSSFKVEAGKATDEQLRAALQSAAEALSAVCAESRKTHAQLNGHLRGTFHIEADGTVRMFAERGSEITPPEAKDVSDNFVGATFGGKVKFPRLGSDLLLTIDYEIQ
ncbi:MAG TPA: hypothetical protein VK615_15535 [Candidatus Binatia bacterium]|nr:hypothetical protein [Candidatus Binatia bacterium]